MWICFCTDLRKRFSCRLFLKLQNLSSAVGPFAIDTGLVDASGIKKEVRIHNTNSGKLIVSKVPLRDGLSEVVGDFSIPGVSGTGAKVQLDFLDPEALALEAYYQQVTL